MNTYIQGSARSQPSRTLSGSLPSRLHCLQNARAGAHQPGRTAPAGRRASVAILVLALPAVARLPDEPASAAFRARAVRMARTHPSNPSSRRHASPRCCRCRRFRSGHPGAAARRTHGNIRDPQGSGILLSSGMSIRARGAGCEKSCLVDRQRAAEFEQPSGRLQRPTGGSDRSLSAKPRRSAHAKREPASSSSRLD